MTKLLIVEMISRHVFVSSTKFFNKKKTPTKLPSHNSVKELANLFAACFANKLYSICANRTCEGSGFLH